MAVFRIFLMGWLALLLLATPSFANDAALEAEGVRVWKMLPRPSEMIRHPSPKSWAVYGQDSTGRVKTSKGVPGDKALSVKIKKARQNAYDVGANANTQLAVKSGDVIAASFWARAAKLPDGKTSTTLPYALQQSSAPYAQLVNKTAELTSEWQQFFAHATLARDFKTGGMGVAVHLSGAAHTVELGPVYIMNMGPGAVSDSDMPGVVASVAEPSVSAPANTSGSISVPADLQSDLAKIQAKLPSQGTLIASPNVNNAKAFGDNKSARLVSDRGVPGGQALEVTVKQAGLNSFSTGINWATSKPIAKGDVIMLAYWAKGVEAKNEAQTPIISPVKVQESGGSYNSAASGAGYLSRDWQLYYATGKSDYNIAPGQAGMSFHMGLTAQTLRLGPAYAINLGPNADVTKLPRNTIRYAGQDANAPWRAKAAAQIEAHRKADIKITVTDPTGKPLAGQTVRAKMTHHAFHFGTFTNHKFVPANAPKNEKLHDSFFENFNMATLPLYWQDWGWNGDMRKDYEAAVKFMAERDVPWRGHPILWPGEPYMPSYIKDAGGNSKKQRKQVLDHVREVMTFVKDYDPIAVDMVNEVRVNHYFKDAGDPDLIADAFALAHAIAPDIPLFVNDYAILNNGGFNQKAIEFYHDWIRDMRRKNVPLGGIGFQGHFGAGLTAPDRIMEILDDFGQYDLPLHITEFDIETYDEDTQAQYTRDILTAAFASPALDAFVIWGWWEGDHWKNSAAMLREDFTEKPNFKAWRDTIYDAFWTDETVITDANGVARLRGFKGDYHISSGDAAQSLRVEDAAKVNLVVSQ